MSLKLTIAATAIAAAAMTGASAANAHPPHRHFFGPHVRIIIGDPVPSCGWLRERWEDTGLFYWKRRYFECKGWW